MVTRTTAERLQNILTNPQEAIFAESNETPSCVLIKRKEAAKLLGISLPTLHSLTKHGDIPAYRVGKSIRYIQQELFDNLKKVKN